MDPEPTTRGATLSPCGRYRYHLWRTVTSRQADYDPKRIALMCGLNPSTADAFIDDPTIRREIFFAGQAGCGILSKVNLFAFRATDPKDLEKAAEPYGPENHAHWATAIRACKESGGVVIAAWGAHKMARSTVVHGDVAPSDRFRMLVDNAGLQLMCFGLTKDGAPKHPLYLPNETKLVPFSVSP